MRRSPTRSSRPSAPTWRPGPGSRGSGADARVPPRSLRQVIDSALGRRWRDVAYAGLPDQLPSVMPSGRPLTWSERNRLRRRVAAARAQVGPLQKAADDVPMIELSGRIARATEGVIGREAEARIGQAVQDWARERLGRAASPELVRELTQQADLEVRRWLVDGITPRTRERMRETVERGLTRALGPEGRAEALALAQPLTDALVRDLDDAFAATLAGQVADEAGIPVIAARQLLSVKPGGDYTVRTGDHPWGTWAPGYFTDAGRHGWNTFMPRGQAVTTPALRRELAPSADALVAAVDEAARQVVRITVAPFWQRPFLRTSLADAEAELASARAAWQRAVAEHPPMSQATPELLARTSTLAEDLARTSAGDLGVTPRAAEQGVAYEVSLAAGELRSAELRASMDELWRRAEAGELAATEQEARQLLRDAVWPRHEPGREARDALSASRFAPRQAEVWIDHELEQLRAVGGLRALERSIAQRPPADALRTAMDRLDQANRQLDTWFNKGMPPSVQRELDHADLRVAALEVRIALRGLTGGGALGPGERALVARADQALQRLRTHVPDLSGITRSELPSWLAGP